MGLNQSTKALEWRHLWLAPAKGGDHLGKFFSKNRKFLIFPRVELISWRFHFAASCLCVVALSAGVLLLHSKLQQRLRAREVELSSLENRREQLDRLPRIATPAVFTAALPHAQHSDRLLAFLGEQAQARDVRVASLAVQHSTPSLAALTQVQLQMSLRGTYGAIKSLLAEMLGRYASLAVQSLDMKASAQDGTQLEAQVSLIWFVKD